MDSDTQIAVVGLGYVGLPLAVSFGQKYSTVGFDISEPRIATLRDGVDSTGEMAEEQLRSAANLSFTNKMSDLQDCDIIVVAVPTPIDSSKQPDLSALKNTSSAIGKILKKGATVVYESTVYPGVTEDVCAPILERESGYRLNEDYFLGYSPERINPGDKVRTIEKVVKVVSGSDAETTDKLCTLYGSIVEAGIHRASSIKVAEASKVIENTQRDLNIALMNELAIIFHRLGIDTIEVLEAAGTKWNFLPFRPGLVGGHCIGVDPYYLTHKAELVGYHPQVILAGRRINDGMGKYVAESTVKALIHNDLPVRGASVLVMGLAFKEDCKDIRNTRVIDLVTELADYGVKPVVWDPVADKDVARSEYGLELVEFEEARGFDAIVAAVPHKDIVNTPLASIKSRAKAGAPFIDVKSAFSRSDLQEAGFHVWRL